MNDPKSSSHLYSAAHYEALLKAITAVSINLNPPALLTELARQLTQTFQVTSVYISDWNPGTGLATVLAEFRSPEANSQEMQSDIGISYDLFNEVKRDVNTWQSQYPLLFHVDDPHTPPWDRQHLAAYNVKTSLVVPMRLHNQIIGFAELWESRRRREYTPAEIELCQAIAQQGAIALVNARLYETESRRRREAETLLEIAGYLSGTLELDEVLTRSLDAVRRYLTNISTCSISI
ncbi:MAG TPA: GAF domain-containing protein, partial [Chloroflexota bacterium]|nr:GAF domain-containing protein [Chloroflexota bacterium]